MQLVGARVTTLEPKSCRAGYQNDAHEAGLARVFQCLDLSFRLGDRNRYPALSNSI